MANFPGAGAKRGDADAAPAVPEENNKPGYTPGMKTAVSIPDDLQRAERLARLTPSRSEVYETIRCAERDEVTAAMNRACGKINDKNDVFLDGHRLLQVRMARKGILLGRTAGAEVSPDSGAIVIQRPPPHRSRLATRFAFP